MKNILRSVFCVFGMVFLLLFPAISHAQSDRIMYSDTSHRGVPWSKDPHVVYFKGKYLMYYTVPNKKEDTTSVLAIGIAESRNLVDWKKVGEITPAANAKYECKGICAPGALVRDGKINLFYQTYGKKQKDAICHAVSDDGIHFKRNSTNPIFHPTGDWNCGRAIDAEVCEFKGRYFLYFAMRDTSYRIQQQGVAVAPSGTHFNREDWTLAADSSILYSILDWEGECMEAASVIEKNGKLFMFYAGSYNNKPQQIGVAESEDGIVWKRMSDEPFLRNGKSGEWNSSKSGHPHIFTDLDGRTYLFYQGNNDNGKTYFITNDEVIWRDGKPYLKKW